MIVHVRLYEPSERDYGTVAEYLSTIHRHGPTVTPSDAVRFALKVTAALITRLERKRERRDRQAAPGGATVAAGGTASAGTVAVRPAAGPAPAVLPDGPRAGNGAG